MKKSIYIFAISIHVIFNALCTEDSILQKTILKHAKKHINIYPNEKSLSDLGFGSCEFSHNGEALIIRTFIKKDDIIFDVGAYIGEWTKAVLKETESECSIYAFEPIPYSYQSLETLKTQLNNKVVTFNLAIGKKETECEMNYFFEKGSDASTLFHRPCLSNIPVKKVKVAMTYLDKFAHEQGVHHINFLKIDTEGTELDILVGAQKLIENNAIDIIQFEYGGTYSDAHITLFDVYHYLTSHRYVIFRITPDGLIHISEWNEALENFRYSNYLALKMIT